MDCLIFKGRLSQYFW